MLIPFRNRNRYSGSPGCGVPSSKSLMLGYRHRNGFTAIISLKPPVVHPALSSVTTHDVSSRKSHPRIIVFHHSPRTGHSYTQKRVIVTPAVNPRFIELLRFDIQSTGQKSRCVNTRQGPSQRFVLIRQSDSLSPCQF